MWYFPTHSSCLHMLPSIRSPDYGVVMLYLSFFLCARIGCIKYVGSNFVLILKLKARKYEFHDEMWYLAPVIQI